MQVEQALKRKEGGVEQTIKGWRGQDKTCHNSILTIVMVSDGASQNHMVKVIMFY